MNPAILRVLVNQSDREKSVCLSVYQSVCQSVVFQRGAQSNRS